MIEYKKRGKKKQEINKKNLTAEKTDNKYEYLACH